MLITNHEVFSFLKAVRSKADNQDLRTIEYEVIKYLESVPSQQCTLDQLQQCMTALSKYSLTKLEKLVLLNHFPKSLVEIYPMIEECETRFSDEQLQEMIDVLQSTCS